MPLVEVVGKGDSVLPEQTGATALNKGVIIGLTTIVIDFVIAHCPAVGVKVYVFVIVLLTAGDHVPVMPLREVVGKVGAMVPEQVGSI